MEENKAIPAEDVLQMALDRILDISVPVKYALQISKPLNEAAALIEDVINAMKEANAPETPAEVVEDA